MPGKWHRGRHHHGPYRRGTGRGHHYRRRSWGLRRRLTLAFAFVALAAVGLTTWLTLGAVFQAQSELFDSALQDRSGQDQATQEQQDGRHFGPPWWLGGEASDPWWGDDSDRPQWSDPQFAAARQAFRGVSRTAFLAAVISFLLAVFAAAFVTRFLTRPLAALTKGAERLGAGERGIRLDLPRSRDELRRLTEAFNDLVAGLERQEAWRRDMVADVAHDLRTPLSVLRGEIEAMQDGVERTDAGSLARLHAEVMMMARLVDDLRALSLAESGALSLEPQATRLRQFLKEVADSFALSAQEAGAEIEVAVAHPHLVAEFDRQRIRQLLGNLLDNALRHGGASPVELGAEASGSGVRLWVSDRGPGLSDEAIQRVFERFYRVDQARSRLASGAGSGLGMAIAKALAEAHGGRIDVRNHDQGGAIFSVWLPGPVDEAD